MCKMYVGQHGFLLVSVFVVITFYTSLAMLSFFFCVALQMIIYQASPLGRTVFVYSRKFQEIIEEIIPKEAL